MSERMGPEQAQRLEQVLRARVAAAAQSIRPEPRGFLGWMRQKPPEHPLAFRTIAINGATTAIRTGIMSLVPAQLVFQVGAKVGLDLFETYFNQTFRANLTATRSGAEALSYRLVDQVDVAAHHKEQVAQMRHCIRATIYAVAEFIELEGMSLQMARGTELEPAKLRQISSFIDSTYRWKVSYRSMATALSLFVQENADIVKRIERARATRSDDTRRLFQLNAVFSYEVADVIIGFLQAFELQGIPELKRLHGEIMAEIGEGRTHLAALETQMDAAWSAKEVSQQKFEKSAQSIAGTRRALDLIRNHWNALLDKIEGSERSATRLFGQAIRRLEIIKLEAKANLTVAGLVAVTDAVQDNFTALGDMLDDIERIDVMPITDDDVRMFLNINANEMGFTVADDPNRPVP